MSEFKFPGPTRRPKDAGDWLAYALIWGLLAPVFLAAIAEAVVKILVGQFYSGKTISGTTSGVLYSLSFAAYYTVQISFNWKAWFISFKAKAGNVQQRGRHNANNGGMNIEMKGKNQNLTLTAPQQAPPPTVVVVPHPAPVAQPPKAKPGELRLESFEALGPSSRICHARLTNVGDRATGIRELGLTPLEPGATPGRVRLRPVKGIPELTAQAAGAALPAAMARAPTQALQEALDAILPGHTVEFYFEAPTDRYFMGGLDANLLRVEVVPRDGNPTTAFLKCSPWQHDGLAVKLRGYSIRTTEQDARQAQTLVPPHEEHASRPVNQIVAFDQAPTRSAKSNPVEPPATGPVLDKTFEIEATAITWETLDLARGDTLEGTIESDQPLSAYIMSEGDFMKFRTGENKVDGYLLLDDEVAAEVKWKAPRNGRFRLVFDAKGKQNAREVTVMLRRKAAVARIRT